MLTLNIVNKRFNTGLTLFENLSLSFPQYGMIGFFGPSGCGKTTLAKMIAKLDNDYQGSIRGNKAVVYISDHVHLFDELTVSEHLKMVETTPSIMDEPLNAFGLINESDKKTKVLSIGQRKRLALLLALHRNARILILDEISSGLDQTIRNAIMPYVQRYASNHLVIWISHDEYEMDHYMDGVVDFTKSSLSIVQNRIEDDMVKPFKFKSIFHPWYYLKSKRWILLALVFMNLLLVGSTTFTAAMILSANQTSYLYDRYDHGSTILMSYPLHNDPIEGYRNFYYDYPVFDGSTLMQWMEDDPQLWGVVARTSNEYEVMSVLTIDGQNTVIKPFGEREMTSIYRPFYHEEYGADVPNYPFDAPFVLEKPLDQYLGPYYVDRQASGYAGQDHTQLNQVDIIHLNPSLESLPLQIGTMPEHENEVVIDQKLADFLLTNGVAANSESLIGSSFPIYMNDYEKNRILHRGVTVENYEIVESRPSQATMEMVTICGILDYPLGDHYVVFSNTPVGMDPLSQHYYYNTETSVFPEIMLFYDPTIDIQEKLNERNTGLDHDGGIFVTMDHDTVKMDQSYRNSAMIWILSISGAIAAVIMIVLSYFFLRKRFANDALLLKNIGYNRKKIQWMWTVILLVITTVIACCGVTIAVLKDWIPLTVSWICLLCLMLLGIAHGFLIHHSMQH